MSEAAVEWRDEIRRVLMAVALIAAALIAAMAPLSTGNAAERASVFPGWGGPGRAPAALREVSVHALPDATASDIAARPQIEIGALSGTTPSQYAARKAIAAHRGAALGARAPQEEAPSPKTSALMPEVLSPSGAAPLTNLPQKSFAGNSQTDCAGAAVSDQALAIGDGTAPILQVNNDCLSVWTQAGARLLGPKTLQAFAGLPAGETVFSPRALYDWHNHRFIVAFGDTDLVNKSYYDIAVSVSDDPTGAWHVYRFLTPTRGAALNDFIRLGQDRQGVYVASNLFNLNGGVVGAFLFEEWIFLPKALLYAGILGANYWHQSGMMVNGQFTDSTQPANAFSPYDSPRAEFLVGSFNINYGGGNCVNGCNGLMVWAVANPFGWINGGPTPEVSGGCCTGTTTYYLPPNASQPGAPNSIETLDTRITGEVTYKSGILHAALTTADSTMTPPWSDILVYRIEVWLGAEDSRCTGQYQYLCPQLTNWLTFEESRLNFGGNFAFYPTPQPDLEGNVFTVFNYSGLNCPICYPSLAYVSQRATTPPGAFSDSGLLLAASNAPHKTFPWGRYTAATPYGVGYTNGGSTATPGVGLAGTFAKSGGSWGTQIGLVAYTAPSQP